MYVSVCTHYIKKSAKGFPGGSVVKNPPAMWETWIRSLDWEDRLEKGKATHSSILAWRIPWTVYSVAKVTKQGFNSASSRY